MPNRLARFLNWITEQKPAIPREIREASHRLRNAAQVSEGRNYHARREMDTMREWIRDMRDQGNVST